MVSLHWRTNSSHSIRIALGKLFKVEQNSRPLSEKTILEHHRLISTIHAYAEKEMLVQYNAAEKVVNKPKTERVKDINYFELADLEKMRDCLSSEPLKWQVITNLLIATGCRRGEIVSVKLGLYFCSIALKNIILMGGLHYESRICKVFHRGAERRETD